MKKSIYAADQLPPKPVSPYRLFTFEEAAEQIGCCGKIISKAVKLGLIKTVKMMSEPRITHEELKRISSVGIELPPESL